MTVRDQTNEALSVINTIDTFVNSFSMDDIGAFFDEFYHRYARGKNYVTTIDFIIDVLNACGLTSRDISDYIITKIFDIPNTSDLYKSIGDIPEGSSILLDAIEDTLKVFIADVLTAILSCNVNPKIPNWLLDSGEGMSIPESLIDFQGLLHIQPVSEIGKCYYNTKNYYNGNAEKLKTDELYMSHDLNAFIWYCLNRGIKSPMSEQNKMLWDNRKWQKRIKPELRDDYEKWSKWLDSKKTASENIHAEGDDDNKDLFPIIQLSRDRTGGDDRRLKVKIPSQTYNKKSYNPSGETSHRNTNRTIYKFNNDYLRSIRILEPKVLLTGIVNGFLEGGINVAASAHIDYQKTLILGMISGAIKKMMERDDYQSNDCFYSFSNDSFNEMLEKMELQKYSAKYIGDEALKAGKYSRDDIIKDINTIFDSEPQDQSTMIKSFFSDISVTQSGETELIGELSLTLGLDIEGSWLSNLIIQIITPIVNSVITPQVMLLFYINFEVMGISVNKKNPNFSDIMSFLLNKLLSLIVGIVRYIKDTIVDLLYRLFSDVMGTLKKKFDAWIGLETTRNWLILLTEAMSCLPTFNGLRISGEPDDVRYADIIPEQTIPESETGKCDI